ncbi:MAG: CsgG/HfaB family protein [bacterium]
MKDKIIIAGLGALLAAGCAGKTGQKTIYEDVSRSSRVAGVGIESQDIVAMADKMMRDLMATPSLAGRTPPPRVIIDSKYFKNESSSRINKNIITDRLRVSLNRSAGGRLIFVGRENLAMVSEEKKMKESGKADTGVLKKRNTTLGADYRLSGRITSLDVAQSGSSKTSRFHQIMFEMIDLESGQIVWSKMYDFNKTAQDDIIYR